MRGDIRVFIILFHFSLVVYFISLNRLAFLKWNHVYFQSNYVYIYIYCCVKNDKNSINRITNVHSLIPQASICAKAKLNGKDYLFTAFQEMNRVSLVVTTICFFAL